MESCHALQLTRAIGLSNFNHQQIKDILDIAKVKPINNQVHN
jgi:diketogulonate reductase-like aldo/keto reductase